jgi:hypothetical protein
VELLALVNVMTYCGNRTFFYSRFYKSGYALGLAAWLWQLEGSMLRNITAMHKKAITNTMLTEENNNFF